jgi:hypothetical protein
MAFERGLPVLKKSLHITRRNSRSGDWYGTNERRKSEGEGKGRKQMEKVKGRITCGQKNGW